MATRPRGSIGKKLSERAPLPRLADDVAIGTLERALAAHARPLVEVRAEGPHMIACLVCEADAAVVRTCRKLHIDVRLGGSLVFGLAGEDAARLFGALSPAQRAWLREPCGARETKVLLLASGVALLSLEVCDGVVSISAGP